MSVRARASVLAALLGIGGVVGLAHAPDAVADHSNCSNEDPITQGGDDFSVNIGPGLLFVGLDKGDQQAGVPDAGSRAIVCVQSAFLGWDHQVTVDRGDVPRVEFGSGCAVDILGGSCEVPSFQIVVGDGDAYSLVTAEREGLPVGDGTTGVPASGGTVCVLAVGQQCS